MSKLVLLFIGIFLFADFHLKTYKTLENQILKVKKIGKNVYYVTTKEYIFKCPLKDFFDLKGKSIYIGSENNRTCVYSLDENNRSKEVDFNGSFVDAVDFLDNIYLAIGNTLYRLNSDLKVTFKKRYKFIIDKIVFVKNGGTLLISGNTIYFINGEKFMNLLSKDDALYSILKYKVINNDIFVIYKYVLDFNLNNLKLNSYFVKKFGEDGGFEIKLDEEIKDVYYIDDYLYVVTGNKIYIYKKENLVGEVKTKNVIGIFKYKGNIYIFYPHRIDILEKIFNNCRLIDKYPIKIVKAGDKLLVIYNHKIEAYNKDLTFLWDKEFKAKINNAKFINGYIYLIGAKNNRFWIAKLKSNKLLKEITLYPASSGFDLVKTDKGFLAVGYKMFDFLGDYIKSLDVVVLNKYLKYLYDATFGSNGVGRWIFRIKNSYYVLGKFYNKLFVLMLNSKARLKGYKEIDSKVFYSAKVINNKLYFSVDDKMYYINRNYLLKYNDLKKAIVVDSDKFINEDGCLIIDNKEKCIDDYEILGAIFDNTYYFLAYKDKKYFICKY